MKHKIVKEKAKATTKKTKMMSFYEIPICDFPHATRVMANERGRKSEQQ